jgi:hypothetical protein
MLLNTLNGSPDCFDLLNCVCVCSTYIQFNCEMLQFFFCLYYNCHDSGSVCHTALLTSLYLLLSFGKFYRTGTMISFVVPWHWWYVPSPYFIFYLHLWTHIVEASLGQMSLTSHPQNWRYHLQVQYPLSCTIWSKWSSLSFCSIARA